MKSVSINLEALDANEKTNQAAKSAWKAARARLKNLKSGYYDTPVDESLSQVGACVELAKKVRGRLSFTDVVLIGIGGSSLGPIALIEALGTKRNVDFTFLENPDTTDLARKLARLIPESTLVVIVTKSGGTFETLAVSNEVLQWLGTARIKDHVIAITDPAKGELRGWAKQHSVDTLSIAPSVGGRYSVFTPVGLFALELAGHSAQDFLRGAEVARNQLESDPSTLLLWAAALFERKDSHNIHVMMTYSTVARFVANWWVQLWSESLGKDRKGFTAIASVGATDQHSSFQLVRDGPRDKILWFVDWERSASLPASEGLFKSMSGIALADLLAIECASVKKVCSTQNIPHLSLTLNGHNAESYGELMFTLCALTSLMGEFLGVNPYDQPGVEEAKIYIEESLKDLRLRHEEVSSKLLKS
jgi:glucose-6-phosphate isomerase